MLKFIFWLELHERFGGFLAGSGGDRRVGLITLRSDLSGTGGGAVPRAGRPRLGLGEGAGRSLSECRRFFSGIGGGGACDTSLVVRLNAGCLAAVELSELSLVLS